MTDIRANLWKIYIYRFLSEFYLIVPILIPYYESNHPNSDIHHPGLLRPLGLDPRDSFRLPGRCHRQEENPHPRSIFHRLRKHIPGVNTPKLSGRVGGQEADELKNRGKE